MDNMFEEFSKQELMITDIQFLGLKQQAWQFSRGMRLCREYLYPNDDVAVKDVYTYTMSADNRSILAVTRTLEWYDDQGVKQLDKDISPDLNIKNLKDLNRAIRQGRMDYMEAAAEELAILAPLMPEPYKTDFAKASDSIDIVMTHYEKEINHYIARGTQEFEDAVRNESNPIMLEIFDLKVRPPDAYFAQGLTVQQTILHQLTGEYNP